MNCLIVSEKVIYFSNGLHNNNKIHIDIRICVFHILFWIGA